MRYVSLLIPAALCALDSARFPSSPRFERVFALAPDEGVFAYARISPDGQTLAYASETRQAGSRRVLQTVTIVDLKTQKILFTEPGIDAYWSNDGTRMVYLSFKDPRHTVNIRNHKTGAISRDIAPAELGDYFSWARRDGRDLILTINGNYYYLNGDRGMMPHGTVPRCTGIGRGERPLISKDGRHITSFVRGTLVVRSLDNCAYIFNTNVQGAKADFSWDGRYVAFHAPRTKGRGYEIRVVDLQERTIRTVTNLRGSSLFPSWTRDGRLCFRYDGDDYRGFLMASNVLSAPARPLPSLAQAVPATRTWADLFPETPKPRHEFTLVMVWSTWSAHSPMALRDLQRARADFRKRSLNVGVLTGTDPGSQRADIERLLALHDIDLPRIPLAPERFVLTEGHNQIPVTLLFRHNVLHDRRLGAQTAEQLHEWVRGALQSAPVEYNPSSQ